MAMELGITNLLSIVEVSRKKVEGRWWWLRATKDL
jgi:hypothetical protein